MLPVGSIVTPLLRALTQGNSILVAPPGAGKSTFLPLQLLNAAQFQQQKIIMLQPRRVVVRSIATYLAAQLDQPVGQTIGYRIRGEQKVSADTRLEIVTEGLLTRMLQQDPSLAGVGLIIFDEFHERSLHADFSLALSIEAQQGLREDLRLLVMSATLDAKQVHKVLPDATLVQCQGRSFAVAMHYRARDAGIPLAQSLASLTRQAIVQHQGNILVFLPGSADIRQLAERLQDLTAQGILLCPLYGDLDKKQQMQAIAPTLPGQRKVVLATNIAETSLTIEGIAVVIDSGLEKVAIFHLGKGVSQLKQQQISQASATQRAGRAGRLGPGICYRLWSEESQQRMSKQSKAQILQADMAPMMLEAAIWGSDLTKLPLLDRPSAPQLSQANSLLQSLGALDKQGNITPHGRRMGRLGTSPRLANMLIKSAQWGAAVQGLACLLVAVLETAAKGKGQSVEVEKQLIKILHQAQHPSWKIARQWAKKLGVSIQSQILQPQLAYLGLLIAMAFPDRIGKNRGNGRFLLSGGAGAMLDMDDPLANAPWLVAAELLLGQGADARITLAQSIEQQELEHYFAELLTQQQHCCWDKQGKLIAREQRCLGAIVLASKPTALTDDMQIMTLWCEEIQRRGMASLPFSAQAQSFLQRLRLAATVLPEQDWPDFSDAGLQQQLLDWLAPYLIELRQWSELAKLDWLAILMAQLNWTQQQQLAQLLPERLTVPSGNSHKLHYQLDGSVILAVKMTELYGLAESPTLAQGRLPITVELLSPAMRPIQKTQDLAGFWAGSYKEVQKEMKGRYPKHFWPDNPAAAVATTKTKKHMG